MEFDSELKPQFCSSNKTFGPSDLVLHVQEKQQDLLGYGVRMYLGNLYGDASGDHECMWMWLWIQWHRVVDSCWTFCILCWEQESLGNLNFKMSSASWHAPWILSWWHLFCYGIKNISLKRHSRRTLPQWQKSSNSLNNISMLRWEKNGGLQSWSQISWICTSVILFVLSNCPLFICREKCISEECPQCKH